MIKILLLPYNYFCYNRKLNVFLLFRNLVVDFGVATCVLFVLLATHFSTLEYYRFFQNRCAVIFKWRFAITIYFKKTSSTSDVIF